MYRKIVVDGVEYEYTTGKIHTKIKGVGVFLNTDIGSMMTVPQYCDCCGEPLSQLYPSTHTDPVKLRVTPSDIANKIKKTIPA